MLGAEGLFTSDAAQGRFHGSLEVKCLQSTLRWEHAPAWACDEELRNRHKLALSTFGKKTRGQPSLSPCLCLEGKVNIIEP